jgi:pseudouridine synthase
VRRETTRTEEPTERRTPTNARERSASRAEARPARRPAAAGEERPVRRTSTPGEDRPARRNAERSEARPARRVLGNTEPRPARRVLGNTEERPARRTVGSTEDRPARRPTVTSDGRMTRRPAARPGAKAKPATTPTTPAAPRKTGPRPGGPGQERLQKILAAAGIASRRACETIITEGRVQVNGRTITELGACANPKRDTITVDLVEIQREDPVYILMNKPKGYVTTVKDDHGRPTVMALLKGVPGRLYPVGRLDFNSEGLLLMTNDGALAQVLMGPEHEIPKVYLVKVHRNPSPELLKEFQEGFLLSGQRLKPCHIEVAEKGDNPWLKVTLTEGKNQQIRRMFAAVGHPVSKLRRVQFGPLADPLLKPGTWRYLSPQEIAAIKSL